MAGRVRNISFPQWLHDAIAERAKAAGESFPRTIERLWDESTGNLQRCRHDTMQPLGAIRLNVATLRKLLDEVSGPSSVMNELRNAGRNIEADANEISLRLAKPDSRTRPGT